MENLLIGILKFLGNVIEIVPSYKNPKKAILFAFAILGIAFIILFYLTKDYN